MIHKQPGSFPRSDLLTDTGERRWNESLLNVTAEDEEPNAFSVHKNISVDQIKRHREIIESEGIY